jgi:hypothetical protein
LTSGNESDSLITIDLNGVFKKMSSSKYLSNIYTTDGTITGNRSVNLGANKLTINASSVNSFSIDGSTFSIDAQNHKVGIGTPSPNAKLDIRTSPNSISDPGEGMLGIGTSNLNANSAGAGAIKYNPTSGGNIEYSNGSLWTRIEASTIKSVVIAHIQNNAYLFLQSQNVNVTNWTKVKEVGHDPISNPAGYFNPATGIYTAPRSGNYLISCNLLPVAYISTGGQMEAKIYVNGQVRIVTVIGTPVTSTPYFFGAPVNGALVLNAGDQVSIRYWSGFGGSDRLCHDYMCNTLSIIEL